MAMEKRARFQSQWLPYALLAPQIAVTLVFFFLPAGQAVYQSVLIQDAFGGNVEFVWFDNFKELFNDPLYLASFKVTAVFSVLVASLGLVISLILAAFADRVIRGANVGIEINQTNAVTGAVVDHVEFVQQTTAAMRWNMRTLCHWRARYCRSSTPQPLSCGGRGASIVSGGRPSSE